MKCNYRWDLFMTMFWSFALGVDTTLAIYAGKSWWFVVVNIMFLLMYAAFMYGYHKHIK